MKAFLCVLSGIFICLNQAAASDVPSAYEKLQNLFSSASDLVSLNDFEKKEDPKNQECILVYAEYKSSFYQTDVYIRNFVTQYEHGPLFPKESFDAVIWGDDRSGYIGWVASELAVNLMPTEITTVITSQDVGISVRKNGHFLVFEVFGTEPVSTKKSKNLAFGYCYGLN